MAGKIVLGVCGSVAAVNTVNLVRRLVKEGLEVECAMTKAAQKIIHPNVLEWASGNPVITELTGEVEHVKLCGANGSASLLLICPATSNTISKIANGIDDTVVTTLAATALGSKIPIIMVPAMHISMYDNPFVVDNIQKLESKGVTLIEPRIEEDKAKIAENDEIVKVVLKLVKE